MGFLLKNQWFFELDGIAVRLVSDHAETPSVPEIENGNIDRFMTPALISAIIRASNNTKLQHAQGGRPRVQSPGRPNS